MRETVLRVGFMPLIDAAIPLAAAAKGFDARRGLRLDLVRETSWANIRDRLAIGHFDAAHLLAPMPVAAALGLTTPATPLIAPMALGLGGNAVSVSGALWARMRQGAPQARVGDPREMGAALAKVATTRRLAFGVVHPFSAHNYELRYWLAACGVDPDRDVDIVVVPPPFMPEALRIGRIDGFCVGEPWSSVAAATADGRVILTKNAIWRSSPEKVLGLRADWADAHPDLVTRLIDALIDAALWCGEPANRAELAAILAAPEAIGAPAAQIAPALEGRLRLADGALLDDADFLVFARGAANFPWKSHAAWFARQMARWGQTTATPEDLARAADCYRPDLYRAACRARGLDAPAIDERPDAAEPVRVAGLAGPLDLPAGGLFDVVRRVS